MHGSAFPSQVVSLSMGLSQSTTPGHVYCQHRFAAERKRQLASPSQVHSIGQVQAVRSNLV